MARSQHMLNLIKKWKCGRLQTKTGTLLCLQNQWKQPTETTWKQPISPNIHTQINVGTDNSYLKYYQWQTTSSFHVVMARVLIIIIKKQKTWKLSTAASNTAEKTYCLTISCAVSCTFLFPEQTEDTKTVSHNKDYTNEFKLLFI